MPSLEPFFYGITSLCIFSEFSPNVTFSDIAGGEPEGLHLPKWSDATHQFTADIPAIDGPENRGSDVLYSR